MSSFVLICGQNEPSSARIEGVVQKFRQANAGLGELLVDDRSSLVVVGLVQIEGVEWVDLLDRWNALISVLPRRQMRLIGPRLGIGHAGPTRTLIGCNLVIERLGILFWI